MLIRLRAVDGIIVYAILSVVVILFLENALQLCCTSRYFLNVVYGFLTAF